MMFLTTIPFYALTLEEFYSGILIMPAFSGPDDAALALLFSCFATGYYGSENWATEVDFFGFGSMRVVHMFGYVLLTFEIVSNIC